MFIADGVFRKYIALSEDFLDSAFDVAGQKPVMELSAEEGSFSGKDANGASRSSFWSPAVVMEAAETADAPDTRIIAAAEAASHFFNFM